MKKEPLLTGQAEPPATNNTPAYWKKWYVAVIAFLLAQIIFYYLITAYFK